MRKKAEGWMNLTRVAFGEILDNFRDKQFEQLGKSTDPLDL